MTPDEFFGQFVAHPELKNQLCVKLTDEAQFPPETLSAFEQSSCSGANSEPVTDDESVIRGVTVPHWDPVRRELASSALSDATTIGMSVNRNLPNETLEQTLIRCLESHEKRMADKREKFPAKSDRFQVTGLSKMAVADIRRILVQMPGSALTTRRAYYVFNSGAGSDPSHADICGVLPDRGSARMLYKAGQSRLLELLMAGYLDKSLVAAQPGTNGSG